MIVREVAEMGVVNDQRRLLELLAASDDGCIQAHLLAQGFAVELIVSAGLANGDG
jgi:hypothetical protein